MAEEVTMEEIAAAQRAVMLEDGCGLTIEGERTFCDDPRAIEPTTDCVCKRAGRAAAIAASQSRPAKGDRIWLLRAMCHTEKCDCADRGGMVDDYDACRLVSRHANAIIDKAAPSASGRGMVAEGWQLEFDALKKFRDQFNEVYEDSYKTAEAIVRHHTNTPAIFGIQPDHRFKEGAKPLDVVADLAQAIAAAKAAPSPDNGWLPGLSFADLRKANSTRCVRWHKGGIEEWSITDWATAVAGELGEACNAIKKLRRIECGAQNLNDPGRQLTEREAAIASIGEELADTLIYLDLLALRLGIDLAAEVVTKFNMTSERYGFPERLAEGPLPPPPAEKEWGR